MNLRLTNLSQFATSLGSGIELYTKEANWHLRFCNTVVPSGWTCLEYDLHEIEILCEETSYRRQAVRGD